MFWKSKHRRFETALRNFLPVGFELPREIWSLIRWLEGKGQVFEYRNTSNLFMPTMPVKNMDHLWSHLAFVIEPDLVCPWFGREGLEKQIVPLVRCGGDGSHFAIWKTDNKYVFVFMGSDGEAFKITEDPKAFVTLITMGYESVEDRQVLSCPPFANYSKYRGWDWPEPFEVKQYVRDTEGVTYPETGESLIASDRPDPFLSFVDRVVSET